MKIEISPAFTLAIFDISKIYGVGVFQFINRNVNYFNIQQETLRREALQPQMTRLKRLGLSINVRQ